MNCKNVSIEECLREIDEAQKRIESAILSQKNVLTFSEAAKYMGISHSCLYKLTMAAGVPYYKPRGKMIYFDRSELEEWLLQNRITPDYEIEAIASTYSTRHPKVGKK